MHRALILRFKVINFLVFFFNSEAWANELISKAPIAFAYTPKMSNFTKKVDILYAGERPRYSSCSGVVWLPGDQFLMSVHLFSGTLSTFRFDKRASTLEHIRCFSKEDGICLNHPENLDISHNGELLVISQGRGTLDFFSLDSERVEIFPRNISLRYTNKDWVHGIAFSKDNIFLASTSIGDSSCICLYKLKKNKYKLHQVLQNKIRPLEPKCIAFSSDNNFLAACYCQTIGTSKNPDPRAQLEIYRFNHLTGLFDPHPISVFSKIPGNMETLKFSQDGSYLLSTDQALDEIFLNKFDKLTGNLLESEVLLKNPDAQLNFPHGLAFSNDGKYLAVTNYGDDRITIYEFASP